MKINVSETQHETTFIAMTENLQLRKNNNYTFLLWMIRIFLSTFLLFVLKSSAKAQTFAFCIISLIVL